MTGGTPTSRPLVFSREAIRRLDELAVDRYGMPSIVLMENAGAGVAAAALRMLRQRRHDRVAVFCGPGNNGGDGLVAARHLHNAGMRVQVVLGARPGRYSGDAAVNLGTIRSMRLPIVTRARAPHLIIDALLGTGLDRPVRAPLAHLIAAINRWRTTGASVLSVDLPSGMDADTGQELGISVIADTTVTLCGWKKGFQTRSGRALAGTIKIADIGVPRELARALATGQGPLPAHRGRTPRSRTDRTR